MYALRTTIILGAFWLLVILSGGYVVRFRMQTKQKELIAKETTIKQKLETDEDLAANLPSVQAEVENVRNLWEYRSKAIPKKETSHETYNYLDQILSKETSSLNFDYFAAEVSDSGGVRFANYKLLGEAKFQDLYRFIWSVEHMPRYLRINSMQMSQSAPKEDDQEAHGDKNWVHFEMSLTALSADRPGFDEVQFASTYTPPAGAFDPFRPPVKPDVSVPPNTLNLPNVFESTLKAMTPNQVYLVDQKGEVKVLSLGDEVYLGRVTDIIPDESRVVFTLDKLNPPKQVSLQIKAQN